MGSQIESKIERAVMRRVKIVHTARPFVSNFAGALVLLGVSLYMLGREVFVAQVFRNLAGVADPIALARFFEAAFLNTTALVQTVTVATFIAAFWLIWECGRQVEMMARERPI